VLDGEIVIMTPHGLDFDAAAAPAAPGGVARGEAVEGDPASFVAFDLLAVGRQRSHGDVRSGTARAARAPAAAAAPPVYLTPVTRDHDVANEWLESSKVRGSTA
jgi:hypothetical protein